jgi:hypothetical protein
MIPLPRRCVVPAAPVVALLALGSPAAAQVILSSAAKVAAAFSQPEETPARKDAGDRIADAMQHPEIFRPPRMDSLVNELEHLAVASPTHDVRMSSASHLSLAGNGTGRQPLPGVTVRLKRVYKRTGDTGVRMLVAGSMRNMPEREEAIAFLRRLALQSGGAKDFPDTPMEAIRVLLSMGSEGRAALQELRERQQLRNPLTRVS